MIALLIVLIILISIAVYIQYRGENYDNPEMMPQIMNKSPDSTSAYTGVHTMEGNRRMLQEYRKKGDENRIVGSRISRKKADQMVSSGELYGTGGDLMEHHRLGITGQSQYDETLKHIALQPSVFRDHKKWADKTVPFSQTAMVLDDMDESVFVNTKNGHGLHTFRSTAPPQKMNRLYITEADPELHRKEGTRFKL